MDIAIEKYAYAIWHRLRLAFLADFPGFVVISHFHEIFLGPGFRRLQFCLNIRQLIPKILLCLSSVFAVVFFVGTC